MASKIETIKTHDIPAIIAALRPRGRGKALSSFNGCTLELPGSRRIRSGSVTRQVMNCAGLEGALIDGSAVKGPIEMTPARFSLAARTVALARPRGTVSRCS
jgi:hypothetical protein